MPIEFEVDTELQPKPYVDNVGIAHIEFALGADLDNGVVPVMSVMLVPGGACQEGDQYNNAYDLRFGIRLRDVDHEWRVTAPDFTKEAVEKYIRREDRPLVLECICKATRYLLDSLNPAQVTMSTFYADLSRKPCRNMTPFAQRRRNATTRWENVSMERMANDIGCSKGLIEKVKFIRYHIGMDRLTRQQIINLTAASQKLVESGRSAPPLTEKATKRFQELRCRSTHRSTRAISAGQLAALKVRAL